MSAGRDEAAAVYRVLRDAGLAGLTREELLEHSWLNYDQLLDTIIWLRTHGVDVRVSLQGDPYASTRFALKTVLPEAWDETV